MFISWSNQEFHENLSDLAIGIFGQQNEEMVLKYVKDVFVKYDDDGSGDLSYDGK